MLFASILGPQIVSNPPPNCRCQFYEIVLKLTNDELIKYVDECFDKKSELFNPGDEVEISRF